MDISHNYAEAVKAIKGAILRSQYRAISSVNKEQLSLYYGVGQYVSENSRDGFWGTGAIETISQQLQKELPGLRDFSAANIKFMRQFYESWSGQLKSLTAVSEVENPDLIFFNRELNALVVIELKKGAFKSSYLGQLCTYLRLVDDQMRKPHENPSIGIVLCKSADKKYVESVIQDYDKPMGVVTYKTSDDMPERLKQALPDMEELKKLL